MKTRIARRTTTTANGTRVTTLRTVQRDVQEYEIQAEAVRRLRRLPGYGDEAAPGVTFTFAADFNAGRRSSQQATIAKATGIVAGEQDLRVYGTGGKMLLLEVKGPKTPISADQRKRHALHRHLGFRVEIIRGKTVEQGAADIVALVQEWLALIGAAATANDNGEVK